MSFQSRVATIGKLRIRYLSAGSLSKNGNGPVLVLLHGGGESALSWRWIIPALAKRYYVLAPDLPGSGDSGLVGDDYEAGFYGRFAGDFVAAMEIDRAVVIGHSLGGLAAIEMALEERGKRACGLVLIASAGLGRELHPALRFLTLPGLGEWSTICASLPLGQIQRLWWRVSGCFAHPARVPLDWYVDQFWMGQRAGLLWDQLAVSRRLFDQDGQKEIVLDRLSDLNVPILVVWGDSDQIIPIAHAQQAIRRLRNGRLTIIPDCGHIPQVERPELLLSAVLQFLATVDTARCPELHTDAPSGQNNNGQCRPSLDPWAMALG